MGGNSIFQRSLYINVLRIYLLYKTKCIFLVLLGENSCQELGCDFLAPSISFNNPPDEWGIVVSQEASLRLEILLK